MFYNKLFLTLLCAFGLVGSAVAGGVDFPPVPVGNYNVEVTNSSSHPLHVSFKDDNGSACTTSHASDTLRSHESFKAHVTCPWPASAHYSLKNPADKSQSLGSLNLGYTQAMCKYHGHASHHLHGCHLSMDA